MRRRAGIADVAQAAGVSTATVSRALSMPERVGAETRARVLKAVAATGYRANAAARDLRQRRARAVTLLAPNLANTFFSRIVAAVQDVAGDAGLTVQISDSLVEVPRLAGLGVDGRSDGVLLLDGGLPAEMVRGWDVPVIMVCEWIEGADLPGVRIDNRAGARMAVQHLLDLGHRHIACLGGPGGNVLSRARADGWRAALAGAGVGHRPGDLMPGDFTMERGARAARDWAAMAPRPTAVFCTSDESALGFISECDRMGLRVPDDVSVIGFDDIEFSDRFIPPLTTIHQPRAALGRLAAERLVAAVTAGAALSPEQSILDCRLQVRGSTAPV
ncbi:LacI family DNA-binding transcriptional regulator [Jannaschia sp. M317]|uniref:LacI family DNA-binding transcriptional regulator n=1 Tax=Jannaschia sp. M317 TaxID=2867011 RepID=UPI0021A8C01D|nr:LacI family DNA-binding transcriptional regulator [Jannaschia sp. M317]UWQ19855.1 LacI family DNA-binding transcriptional regulator [Jannaschia sp. M317]